MLMWLFMIAYFSLFVLSCLNIEVLHFVKIVYLPCENRVFTFNERM
jgi:hypothetical protein